MQTTIFLAIRVHCRYFPCRPLCLGQNQQRSWLRPQPSVSLWEATYSRRWRISLLPEQSQWASSKGLLIRSRGRRLIWGEEVILALLRGLVAMPTADEQMKGSLSNQGGSEGDDVGVKKL